jgi:ribonuclease M5
MIKEVVIVEGRDDEAAVKRAAEAETIATHGFG